MSAKTRKQTSPVRVYVTPSEKNEISELAKSHGLSSSEYLRKVGLGIQVSSVLDKELIGDLAKVNADQGRLGGLLKLWLTNDEKLALFDQDKLNNTIELLLETIYQNQKILLDKASKI
tara:strand:+ start:101 stop:454 length:354 start_codon:yes stop_codon:yes gene_type:complete